MCDRPTHNVRLQSQEQAALRWSCALYLHTWSGLVGLAEGQLGVSQHGKRGEYEGRIPFAALWAACTSAGRVLLPGQLCSLALLIPTCIIDTLADGVINSA